MARFSAREIYCWRELIAFAHDGRQESVPRTVYWSTVMADLCGLLTLQQDDMI